MLKLLLALIGIDIHDVIDIDVLGADNGVATTAVIKSIIDIFTTICPHTRDNTTACLLIVAAGINNEVTIDLDLAVGVYKWKKPRYINLYRGFPLK